MLPQGSVFTDHTGIQHSSVRINFTKYPSTLPQCYNLCKSFETKPFQYIGSLKVLINLKLFFFIHLLIFSLNTKGSLTSPIQFISKPPDTRQDLYQHLLAGKKDPLSRVKLYGKLARDMILTRDLRLLRKDAD
jgi:hypothetical protein